MKSSNKFSRPLFITGTDTSVGKTVLSLLMMQYLYANGLKPVYFKPLQTGCRDPYDSDSDARFIYENIEALRGADPAASILYCFRNPKAPLIAARKEGKAADPGVIRKAVESKLKPGNPLLIEGAGGVLVPVTESVMMADLAALLGAVPVIAARAGLGTINHTLLTVEALDRRGMKAGGIVFLDSGPEPTPPEIIIENISAIKSACGIKVAGTIGRIGNFAHPEEESYCVIEKLIDQLPGNSGE